MFSNFFIRRPIFATVLAILMVIIGAMAYFTLPVAQYPDITPPTVMVSAAYPGADAQTVAQAVAVPIEQKVNGVDGMMYMNSNAAEGNYQLTITFENGTDLDQAAVDVQNRVAQANAVLPSQVIQQGVTVSKQTTNNILFLSLQTSRPDLYDALYLSNYAQLHIVDALSRVKGVGNVEVFGTGNYSMRIWLDPDAMSVRDITVPEIEAAVNAQNMQITGGSAGAAPNNTGNAFQYTLLSQGQLQTPEEFGNIILRTSDTGVLRLKDVAKIELGSVSYGVTSTLNGGETALIGVSQLPGSNAMEVADGVLSTLHSLEKYFPEGVHCNVVMNSTDYVHASMSDLFMTFMLTTLIVMVVILIFLQNWRAVVIPMITIPVSLIATFAVMKVLGFSLNTLTLFGLVLAIAIVVDDAIVVVEDCSRLLDSGKLNRVQAAQKAMKELTGPVVGEVLVLLSVFIPTAFISGITGELYKQFALTIAVSTAFSGFNALTLTPALCALFLKPKRDSKFVIYRWFDSGYARVEKFYGRFMGHVLDHPVISMGAFIVIAAVGIWGFNRWPSSYVPQEDMGYFISSVQLPPGASLERTQAVAARASDSIKAIPGVKDVMTISGFSFLGGGQSSNMASMYVTLEPWKQRGKDEGIDRIIAEADRRTSSIQEGVIFSVNPPAIPGLGMSAGLQMQLLDINNLGPAALEQAMKDLQQAAQSDPRIASVTTMYQGDVPQYRLNFDRNRIQMMHISLGDVYATLGGFMGSAFIDDFVEFGRSYQVVVQAQGEARSRPEDVMRLTVNNAEGTAVPFSTFTTIEPVMGVASLSRYNMYTTASLTANPAEGVSSAEGIAAMEEIVEQTLGDNYGYAWTGEAYQETQAGTTIAFVLVFAVVMTLLVLAAQYESWTDPVAVILSMPIAVLGTLAGVIIMGQSVSIYTQIGLILLLGMSAKNAILIVEYAMDYRKTGVSIRQAAHDAGMVRLRPILMTACAFIFGVLPMLFATGAGANSQRELGTAIVFGMTLNALLGTLFVPGFWMVMQTINERWLSKIFSKPDTGDTSDTSDTSDTGDTSDTSDTSDTGDTSDKIDKGGSSVSGLTPTQEAAEV